MAHPIELTVADAVVELRNLTRSGSIESDEQIVPGAYFSWDSDEADIGVDIDSEPGSLFSVSAQVSGAPRWFSFNLRMGSGRFVAGEVVGIVLELEGDGLENLQFFVRTAIDGSTEDTYLTDSVPVLGNRSVATALHWVDPEDPIQRGEGFHTLVFLLPALDFGWKLTDIRVFVIEAPMGAVA